MTMCPPADPWSCFGMVFRVAAELLHVSQLIDPAELSPAAFRKGVSGMFSRKQNTLRECADCEDAHCLRNEGDVRPKLPDCPSLGDITKDLRVLCWPSLASPQVTPLESGTAGVHMQDCLTLGPVHPFLAGLLFSQ